MHKAKRIYVLLGVLVVLCIAVLAVSQHEEKKEQIEEVLTKLNEGVVGSTLTDYEKSEEKETTADEQK